MFLQMYHTPPYFSPPSPLHQFKLFPSFEVWVQVSSSIWSPPLSFSRKLLTVAFKHLLSLKLNLLGWHCFTKPYKFQVYSLINIICTLHLAPITPSKVFFCPHLPSLCHLHLPPTLFPSGYHHLCQCLYVIYIYRGFLFNPSSSFHLLFCITTELFLENLVLELIINSLKWLFSKTRLSYLRNNSVYHITHIFKKENLY